VSVLIGDGAGGFTPASGSFNVGTDPQSMAVADFNGDGKPDLITANSNSDDVTVLLGASAATSAVLSTTSPLTITVGQTVPLTLTVSGAVAAFHTPTGAVTFFDGATSIGTASQMSSPYTIMASSLGVGSHALTANYEGDTRSLASGSNTITIQVNAPNRPPDCSTAFANVPGQPPAAVGVLWPADHRIVAVGIASVTDPDHDVVTIAITRIFQDELTNAENVTATSVDGGYAGNCPAALGVACALGTAYLRAEMYGTARTPSNGRFYHLSFTATDPSGASCSSVVKVTAPPALGGTSIDNGAMYDSTIARRQ